MIMGIHDKYTSIDCFWKDVRYVIDKSDRNGDTQVNLFSLRINDSVEYDSLVVGKLCGRWRECNAELL